jgi:hypothetical protein
MNLNIHRSQGIGRGEFLNLLLKGHKIYSHKIAQNHSSIAPNFFSIGLQQQTRQQTWLTSCWQYPISAAPNFSCTQIWRRKDQLSQQHQSRVIWFNELEIISTSTLSETTDSNNNKLAKLSSGFVSGGAEGKRMDDFCRYIKQEMQKEMSMLLSSRDIVIELIQNSLIAEPILFLCGPMQRKLSVLWISHFFKPKRFEIKDTKGWKFLKCGTGSAIK